MFKVGMVFASSHGVLVIYIYHGVALEACRVVMLAPDHGVDSFA